MACDSSYLRASEAEVACSQVECFIDELDGKQIDEGWRAGYHPRVYNCGASRKMLDQRIARLCALLKEHDHNVGVRSLSLELQIWWRDHQRADRLRKQAEKDSAEEKALRLSGLAKLTPEERIALGLK